MEERETPGLKSHLRSEEGERDEFESALARAGLLHLGGEVADLPGEDAVVAGEGGALQLPGQLVDVRLLLPRQRAHEVEVGGGGGGRVVGHRGARAALEGAAGVPELAELLARQALALEVRLHVLAGEAAHGAAVGARHGEQVALPVVRLKGRDTGDQTYALPRAADYNSASRL